MPLRRTRGLQQPEGGLPHERGATSGERERHNSATAIPHTSPGVRPRRGYWVGRPGEAHDSQPRYQALPRMRASRRHAEPVADLHRAPIASAHSVDNHARERSETMEHETEQHETEDHVSAAAIDAALAPHAGTVIDVRPTPPPRLALRPEPPPRLAPRPEPPP